ncbi:MAG: hypothetical protein M1133_03155 [Armatimonadetes bacterium]|nr:hypothetical protein [Armatimonadota bacterium]
MRKKRSFWSACESIPGLAAVEAEWRLKSGEQFNAARAFLKPRQAPAASIPCPAKVPCGCYHRIVRHDDGRIAAVCCCEPRSCDVAYVSPGDLIVYELDRQKLHQSIGDALSLRMSEAALPSLRKTTQVGFDSPLAGLDPLKTNGADSLVCSDIQGIEWIKLRELQFFWGGAYKEIVIWRADDVFAMLADKERSIPGNAPIIKASFQIKFEDAKNPRTVSIRPSNIAQFQRDDDGELVEAWLLKREFISVPESEEDEEEEELLVGV